MVTRSYAPFDTFGGGFRGDNRGVSMDLSAKAKVHTWMLVDLNKGSVTAWTWAAPSHADGVVAKGMSLKGWSGQAMPDASGTMDISDGRATVKLDYSGANPLVPGAADIDAHAQLTFNLVGGVRADGYGSCR